MEKKNNRNRDAAFAFLQLLRLRERKEADSWLERQAEAAGSGRRADRECWAGESRGEHWRERQEPEKVWEKADRKCWRGSRGELGRNRRNRRKSDESSAQVAVYVCGAVERPGIVYLPEGSP